MNEAELQQRPLQHYVAIAAEAQPDAMGPLLGELWPAVAQWLTARKVPHAGAPFIRYRVINMGNTFGIEVGIPVAEAQTGEGRVIADSLPAGSYACITHTGLFDSLVTTHAALQSWAADQDIGLQVQPGAEGELWACRLESYLTDPGSEPDPRNWRTEIAYLTQA